MDASNISRVQSSIGQNQSCVVLVDECESLFHLSFNNALSDSKNTLTEMLETNEVPTIYITNHINDISEAFIRRFDMVQELNGIRKETKLEVSVNIAKGLRIRRRFIAHLIGQDGVSIGHWEQAVKVVKTFGCTGTKAEATIMNCIEQYQVACGRPSIKSYKEREQHYDVRCINASGDLPDDMLKAIANSQMGRVLLYGPPGTGKTAYGIF